MKEINTSINCKGKLINLEAPQVMGILNVTPDSFYDGGKYAEQKKVLTHVEKMLFDGLDLLDIGGQSSRPGATLISADDEWKRLEPVINSVMNEFPEIIISVDTFYSKVAKNAIHAGASIINDISAGSIDSEMFKVVRELQVPYVLMHMKGTPNKMQEDTSYQDVFTSVFHFFTEKLNQLRMLGVNDVILDPGFGFGKSQDSNYQLLHRISEFKQLGCPILSGTSRKSMLYKLLNITADEALNATSITNTIALMNGANILRVHDVKEAKQAVIIYQKLAEKCRLV